MNLISVSKEEYSNLIDKPYHLFNHPQFNFLNSSNMDSVYYLLFKDKKVQIGIIGEIKDNTFSSPFSAPFGGFSFVKNNVKINIIDSCISLLTQWCINKMVNVIKITLPPDFYNNTFISKQINSLSRYNFKFNSVELNYQFNCNNFNEEYRQNIWYSARKSLNKSLDNKLEFIICNNIKNLEIAYSIIKRNRQERGFPLRMTFEDIIKTNSLIKKDYFLIHNIDKIAIASAIVYHVSEDIVQIVYWGDIREYSNLRPMNFLSYKIFEYYNQKGMRYIDIGPSTENSIPNYGLCEFKESIGCDISPKYSFYKYLKEE